VDACRVRAGDEVTQGRAVTGEAQGSVGASREVTLATAVPDGSRAKQSIRPDVPEICTPWFSKIGS